MPGRHGYVVRRDRSCEVLCLGTMIRERCAAPIGVLIILVDGLRGQGLGLNLGSRDGGHQGLYQQGGVVGSGSRFLGRRNRSGRSGARSPGRPLLARSGYRLRFQHVPCRGLSARPLRGLSACRPSIVSALPAASGRAAAQRRPEMTTRPVTDRIVGAVREPPAPEGGQAGTGNSAHNREANGTGWSRTAEKLKGAKGAVLKARPKAEAC